MSLVLIKNHSLGTLVGANVWLSCYRTGSGPGKGFMIAAWLMLTRTLCLRTPCETAPRLVFRGKHVDSGVPLININPILCKRHVVRC